MNYLERSKEAWKRASEFPVEKETVYPDHTIVQEFGSHIGKKVYEYGCGNGSDMRSYLKRGNYVTATDIVPENLTAARTFNLEAGFNETQFELWLLDKSYPLPFSDESFDVVSSHGVLHHLREGADEVAKELYRVLKPGGLIYVMLYTEVMYDHFKGLGTIEKFKTQYQIDEWEAFGYCTDAIGVPYSRYYNTEQGIQFLEQAGFEVVDYTYWLNDMFCTYKGVRNG